MAITNSSNTLSREVGFSLLSLTTTDCHTLGGDVNITDEDGDTPLYTVETIETARWLIEHGARYDHVNGEGLTVCPNPPLIPSQSH